MLAAVVTVRVDVPEPFTEAGLKVPFAPLGRPETVRATDELNPPWAVSVAVYVVGDP